MSFPKNLYILCRLFLKHFYCKYEDEEETSNFLKFASLQFLFLGIWRQMIIDYRVIYETDRYEYIQGFLYRFCYNNIMILRTKHIYKYWDTVRIIKTWIFQVIILTHSMGSPMMLYFLIHQVKAIRAKNVRLREAAKKKFFS